MPLSSAARERARALLQPDEEIRYAFPVTSISMGASVFNAHFVVVVTDAGVTVLSVALLSRTKPKSVWGRYPRDTEITLVQMAPGPVYRLGEMEFEVDAEYVAVINAANAEIRSPDPMPPDPLPDL